MGRALLVKTNFGSTLVDEESPVYVRLGGGYLRKLARDLQPDDIVVKHNEGLSLMLEEAIPVLERRLGYRLARDALHERGHDGAYIPRFKTLLLRGLLGADAAGLERRILDADGGFSPEEREELAQRVMAAGVSVQPSTVRGEWLRGRTLAPEDWENFARLAGISPEFAQIHQSKAEGAGFWAAYHLYTTLHRIAPGMLKRRSAASAQGEPAQGSPASAERVEGPFREYVQDLLAAFPGRIDERREEAIVRELQFVERKRAGREMQRAGKALERGLFGGAWDGPLLDAHAAWETYHILDTALQDAIERYTDERFKRESGGEELRLFSILSSSFINAKLRPSSAGEEKYALDLAGICARTGISAAEGTSIARAVYASFLKDMESGRADRLLGSQQYTIAHVADTRREYLRAVPKVFLDIEDASGCVHVLRAKGAMRLGRDERRRLERELPDAQRRMDSLLARAQRDYGGSARSRAFLLTVHTNLLGQQGIQDEEIRAHCTSERLRRTVMESERQGLGIYTRAELGERLARIGLAGAISLYQRENMVTPFFP